MTTTSTTPPTGTGPRTLSPTTAGVLGLLGVASALAVGDLVAGLLNPPASPFLAVGNQFIRITPEWLKQFAIAAFGVYDKLVLLGTMGLVIAVLGVVAGLAGRRRMVPGIVVIAAMGVVAGLCATLSPTFTGIDLVPPLASLVVGVAAFATLHRLLSAAAAPASGGEAPAPDRRRALLAAGGVAAGALVAATLGRLLGGGGATEASREAVGPLVAGPQPPRIPAGADFAQLGTPTIITRNEDFYRIDVALQVPQLRTADYTLRVRGMVDRELTLNFEQLRARRLIEAPITQTCVSNEIGGYLMSTSMFLGVSLADLLAEAGVRPGAEQLFSTSVDGYTTSVPVAAATDGRDAMLAIGMNGEPLPAEHGFPVRMVVPGIYGYLSGCKWITDIEVTTWDARQGFWQVRGWSREAPVKTQSRIDVPRRDATVRAGQVVVAGTAWAQRTGIDRVEVRVDEGRWQPAELAADVSVDTWRMWRIAVDLAPGRHTLQVRSVDRSGYLQTGQPRTTIPDGATGWHSVSVTAA